MSTRNSSSVAIVGLDVANNAFQVHGVDALGGGGVAKQVWRAKLLDLFERLPPCLIGMEACSSARRWARSLIALGHRVKLMPPAYVKPYVRGNLNDAVDARRSARRSRGPTCALSARAASRTQRS